MHAITSPHRYAAFPFPQHRWVQNTRKSLNYSTLPASVKRILPFDPGAIERAMALWATKLLALFAFLTVYVKPLFSIKSPINLKKPRCRRPQGNSSWTMSLPSTQPIGQQWLVSPATSPFSTALYVKHTKKQAEVVFTPAHGFYFKTVFLF